MRDESIVKILRYLIYAVALVPLLIFSDFISPFHVGKVLVFRSLVEIMAVLYLLVIWRNPNFRPRSNTITWAFFAFTGAFALTTITSVLPYPSFWGSLERMGGLFTFIHYFVYFIILNAVFRRREDWLNLFYFMIGIGVISALYGFLQRTDASFIIGSGGRSRIFGTIGNPALFAGYQILMMFLALTLYFRKNNQQGLKIFLAVSVGLTGLAVLMTAVRGSILALAIGIVSFALIYTSVYRSRTARKALLGLIGLGIIFVIFGVAFKNSEFVKSSGYLTRITDFSLTTTTVQTRFWAWEAGFKGWSEGPKQILLGWGPENFNIPFSRYFNPKFYAGLGSETLFDRAHNMFIEVLVTMGVIGFLAYISIFISALKTLWRKITVQNEDTVFAAGLIPLIIAYAIHNSFIFDTSANFITFFTILGFISFIGFQGGEQKPIPLGRYNKNLWGLSAVLLVVLAIFTIWVFNIRPAQANYATTRAIVKSWEGDFAGAVKQYGVALAYDGPGKYEFRHRFAQYVLEKTNGAKLTPEYIEVLNLAVEEVQKNIDENPIDYLPYLYQSRLYIVLGKESQQSEYNDKALAASMKALELSETFVRTYYEIGQAYLNKGNLDEAIKYFQKAVDLNPEVGLSHWYLGIIEVERGNTDRGLKIIQDIVPTGKYGPSESDLNKLVTIYLKRNDYANLLWVYEKLVKSHPTKAQYHASYAVVLVQFGRIDEAVAQAREAAKLDPNFESEAKKFIEQLGRTW